MLAIRMQRIGRKGYPTYRVVVQEAHRQPTSGKVIANLGSYNPHTKEVTLKKDQAAEFLKNGAQPSDRVVHLFKTEKIELPKWVKVTSDKKQKTIKNSEKLRRNQPKEEVVAEAPEAAAEPEVTTTEEAPKAEPVISEETREEATGEEKAEA